MPASSAVVAGINYTAWPPGLSADVISRAGRNSLRCAEADAQAVAAALRGQGYAVTELIGAAATRVAILEALEAAFAASVQEPRIFYFGGHGELDPYNSLAAYLLPADADPYSLYLTAIPLDDLARHYLGASGSALVVLDCCPAGPDPALLGSATAGSGAQFGQRAAAAFGAVPGRAVLAACADDPAAREPAALEHGALTAALLDYWMRQPDSALADLPEAVIASVEAAGRPHPAVGGHLAGPEAPAAAPLASEPTAPLPVDLPALPPLSPPDPPIGSAPSSPVPPSPDPLLGRALPAPAVSPLLASAPAPAPTWQAPGGARSFPRAGPPAPAVRPTVTWPSQPDYAPARPQARPGLWIGIAVAILLLGGLAACALGSVLQQGGAQGQATATAEAAHEQLTAISVAQETATFRAGIQATAATAAQATITALAANATLTSGPQDGKLVHALNNLIKTQDARVELSNFVAAARFVNPYGADEANWDYGFLFRSTGDNQQYRLVVFSTDKWRLQLVAEVVPPPTEAAAPGADALPTPTTELLAESAVTTIASGQTIALDVSGGGVNELRLVADGDTGWFFINGHYVAEFDLSAKTNAGDIEVGSGFYANDEIPGKSTDYSEFTVWALP